MNTFAIEAIDLVKRFPQKKRDETVPENGAQSNDDNTSTLSRGAEKAGQERPAPLKRIFGRRPPKRYFTAVDGVNLQIERGEIFGLLGPNGAGKSTTIRMLCTLLEPTSGTAIVNGYDLLKQPNRVRQSLGTVLAGERSIYWKLTGRENLEYFAALYHVPPEMAHKRVAELLERMELTARADELVEKYSTGMKQRIAISKALIAQPPIILLDEPTLGLDPQAARRVRQLVTELKAEGHTILLTTHYMEEADQLSDRIGIIDKGRIIALDTPANLKARMRQKHVIRLEIVGWHSEMITDLQRLPLIESVAARPLGGESLYEVSLHAENSRQVLPRLIESINTNGTHLVNLKVVEPSLEDVFISLTGKALRD
jgi:ABC-2 type transport system ATP-binding protein